MRHRFRAGKGCWPLTQIGPGILSVNDTEGYRWSGFQPRVMGAVGAVFAAYPVNIAPLKPIRLELRYIDAVPFEHTSQDALQFLRDRLHTGIVLDSKVFDEGATGARPVGVNLTLVFPLSCPKGTGTITLATGKRREEEAIIWNTIVRSEGDDVPQEPAEIGAWLTAARDVVSRWFFGLARGPLMSEFDEVSDVQRDN